MNFYWNDNQLNFYDLRSTYGTLKLLMGIKFGIQLSELKVKSDPKQFDECKVALKKETLLTSFGQQN